MSRILSLQAENFKRLVAVEIRPDGDVVVLSGKNRQGKTSVLDAILAALRGSRFSRETSQTIRDGEDHAWVRVEIGDDPEHIQYIATRRWSKEDAGTLTVESADGARYSSPQKILDDITGDISFDPMSFLDLDAKKQADALVKALGKALPFDPTELAAKRKGVFDGRTEINREITRLDAQLAGMVDEDPTLPAEEVSAAALVQEAAAIQQRNSDRVKVEDGAARAVVRRADAYVELEDARKAVKAAEHALEQAEESVRTVESILADLPPEQDLSEITDRLASAEQTNARIRAQRHRQQVAADLAERKERAAQFTLSILQLDKTKEEGIAAAKFPVPGLSFNDDGVTWNGRAFTQASTEEQYRAAFGVAIASNPKLRVCRIDKGEALDSESFKALVDLAREFDIQLWISKVDESGSVGFVIEDGSVVAA